MFSCFPKGGTRTFPRKGRPLFPFPQRCALLNLFQFYLRLDGLPLFPPAIAAVFASHGRRDPPLALGNGFRRPGKTKNSMRLVFFFGMEKEREEPSPTGNLPPDFFYLFSSPTSDNFSINWRADPIPPFPKARLRALYHPPPLKSGPRNSSHKPAVHPFSWAGTPGAPRNGSVVWLF